MLTKKKIKLSGVVGVGGRWTGVVDGGVGW